MTETATSSARSASASRWARRLAIGVTVALFIGVGGLAALRLADGPTGPIPGGPLRAGPLITKPVTDWTFAAHEPIELQLVGLPRSHLTGGLVHAGHLYVTCDLGFISRRAPEQRFILTLLRLFGNWHEHALRDGRVVLRIAGYRYEGQAVRVTDPGLLATLRGALEARARDHFGAPLLDVAVDPADVWFFRVDPRPGRRSPVSAYAWKAGTAGRGYWL